MFLQSARNQATNTKSVYLSKLKTECMTVWQEKNLGFIQQARNKRDIGIIFLMYNNQTEAASLSSTNSNAIQEERNESEKYHSGYIHDLLQKVSQIRKQIGARKLSDSCTVEVIQATKK
jgi:hypothetical protein